MVRTENQFRLMAVLMRVACRRVRKAPPVVLAGAKTDRACLTKVELSDLDNYSWPVCAADQQLWRGLPQETRSAV